MDLNPLDNSTSFTLSLPRHFPSLVYYNMQKLKEEVRDNLMGSQDKPLARKKKSSSEPPANRTASTA